MKNIIDLNNNELIPHTTVGETNYTTYINNELYYVKKSNYNHKELVISEFCHLLNIPCVEYELAIKNGSYFVISKSYRKDNCKYISGVDLLIEFFNNTNEGLLQELNMSNLRDGMENNLESIWLALDNKYRYDYIKYKDIRNVMIDLLNQYFLMILIQDSDFHDMNWEIEESEDHLSLSPKYDNEGAFGIEILGVPMGVNPDDLFQRTTDSINHFLNITAPEDNSLFLDLFDKATPELFNKAVNNVKNKYDIDKLDEEEKMIDRYQDHYEELSDLLKEKGLGR